MLAVRGQDRTVRTSDAKKTHPYWNQVWESDFSRPGMSLGSPSHTKAFFLLLFSVLNLILLSPTSYQLKTSLPPSLSSCRMLLKNATHLGCQRHLSHSYLCVNWLKKVAFFKAPKRNNGCQVCRASGKTQRMRTPNLRSSLSFRGRWGGLEKGCSCDTPKLGQKGGKRERCQE